MKRWLFVLGFLSFVAFVCYNRKRISFTDIDVIGDDPCDAYELEDYYR